MKKIFFMLLCFCAIGFAQAQTEKGWSLVMNHEDPISPPPQKIEWIKETSNHIINLNLISGKMTCREKSTQKLIWTWDISKQIDNFDWYEWRFRLRYGLFAAENYPFHKSKVPLFVPNVKGVEMWYQRVSRWDEKTYLYINDTTGELKLVGFKRDNPVGIVTWQGKPKE